MKYIKPLLLTTGILLVVGTAGTFKWAGNHVSVKPTNKQATAVQGAETTNIELENTYFKTSMPGYMHQKNSNENPLGPIFGQYLFVNTDPGTADQVGVTVASLVGRDISEVSAVKARTNDPAHYSEITLVGAPDGARIFSSTSGYEVGIFWEHQDKYAAVVVSGTADRRGQLEQVMTTLVSNWQWK